MLSTTWREEVPFWTTSKINNKHKAKTCNGKHHNNLVKSLRPAIIQYSCSQVKENLKLRLVNKIIQIQMIDQGKVTRRPFTFKRPENAEIILEIIDGPQKVNLKPPTTKSNNWRIRWDNIPIKLKIIFKICKKKNNNIKLNNYNQIIIIIIIY